MVVYILLVGYPPFMRDTQAELFQQIRTGAWEFLEEDWENISEEAKELVENLLVVDPAERWTVEDALRSAWIKEPKLENMNRDLMSSLSSLREKRASLRSSQFSDAVYWEDSDAESLPLKASMKIGDSIDEGTSRMSYAPGKQTPVDEN